MQDTPTQALAAEASPSPSGAHPNSASERSTWPGLFAAQTLASQLWLLAALVASVIGERHHITLLLCAVPGLLMIYLRSQPVLRGLLFTLLAYAGTWIVFMRDFAPFMKDGQWVGTVVAASVVAMLPLLADRLLYKRLPLFAALLVFPLAQTGLDLLRHFADPTGTYGLLGYSFRADNPLVQMTALLGVDGLSFIAGLGASALAFLMQPNRAAREKMNMVLMVGTGFALLWGAGLFWRQAEHARNEAAPKLAVAALSGPTTRSIAPEDSQRLLADWLTRTEMAAKTGARVLVWAEGALSIPASFETEALSAVQKTAQENGVHIVASVFHLDRPFDNKRHNKLIWIDSEGRVRAVYHKNHGQFAEGTIKGEGRLAFVDTEWGRFALSICWDADFPSFMAAAAQEKVIALLNPSYDWPAIAPGRGNIARFRAIENRTAMIRPNNNGQSFVSDSTGRLLAAQSSSPELATTLIAALPLNAPTQTGKLPDGVLGVASLIGLLGLSVWGWRRRASA